ncbi:MAG: DUF2304 domain-containing protein [Lachnospiraceae bacterium]|nr:DUF2304 domain-containing protein [Lachnospiraceae bacterium]
MLPGQLRAVLLLAIIVFFVIVLYLLKNRRLALKYTLLWLFTGVMLLILVIWPSILYRIARLIGIQTGMNTLYVLLIAFIIMILMSLTSIVSVQTERIRKLAEANAILEQRVRELEVSTHDASDPGL